jgi:hypothetical protein
VLVLSVSEPGLHGLLEVVLLPWVELFGASGHDLAVSGDHISLVEVVHVVSQGRLVDLDVSLWVELECEVLEPGILNNVKFD